MQIEHFKTNFDRKKDLAVLGDNLWELANDVWVMVYQPAHKGYKFILKAGFVTNCRSGSDLLNPIIPRQGTNEQALCYILHDALYTWNECGEHFMPKKAADELLVAMLKWHDFCLKVLEKKSQMLGSVKIWLIGKSLALFGSSAYKERNPPPYDCNNDKVAMEVLV
jgi:hypothetical protein